MCQSHFATKKPVDAFGGVHCWKELLGFAGRKQWLHFAAALSSVDLARSICITLMAIAGFVGSLVPSWLPCGPMRAIRGSLLPLFLVTAAMVCLAWGETNSSTGLTGLTSFLVSICFVQLILYTPFISSVCQFTCGVEDIAGVASSLLSSFTWVALWCHWNSWSWCTIRIILLLILLQM